MASLVVRNIPESVKQRLQTRAKKHGRSMEEEIRLILRSAANEAIRPSSGLGTEIANLFRGIGLDEPIEEMHFNLMPVDFDDHTRHKRGVRSNAARSRSRRRRMA